MIFIVGMPRSGSTLVESIITMNPEAKDLGETNILRESFLKWNNLLINGEDEALCKLYLENINKRFDMSKIYTNKWLYNYQFANLIATHLPSAKIVNCYRNPLDNIISMYRTQFSRGNNYTSCLKDCAEVYLNYDETISNSKKRYSSKIYNLNYDSLVQEPEKEIRSLIDWLDWEWNKSYLSPHLNPRSVSTASTIQVRSPINPKSVGSWKNYIELLQPAIEILEKNDK